MSGTSNERTPRRRFIGDIALSAAALAGAACATPAASTSAASTSQAPTPAPAAPPARASSPPTPTKWDDSWRAKLSAPHKAVFDSPEIGGGAAIYHAWGYMNGFKQMYNSSDAEVNTVLVFRHRGVPVIFNDVMWGKYGIGEMVGEKDEKTKLFVTKNPYFKTAAGTPVEQGYTLESMVARGAIILGCDLATRGFSFRIAQKAKLDQKAVYEELKQNLIPGAWLMPTGVFATLLAQESGCAFMRST
jgi:hypothetical protein